MSSVLHPVGGEPSGVYWRRRLLILVALLVVLLIVGRACGIYGGSSPASNPTPSTTAIPTTTTASPSPKPTASAKPTTTPTATSTTATAACKDSQVRVFVTVENPQNPVGGPVRIRFVVATDNDTKCLRDVGPARNEVVITSDGRRIWSSDDCTPGGDPNVRPISKSSPYAVTVSWQGDVSRPGCPTARPKAPAGTYSVTGRNGAVKSAPETFTLG